jgi:hypothetical protein
MINLEKYMIPAIEVSNTDKIEDKKLLNKIINEYKKSVIKKGIKCEGVNKYYTFISHESDSDRDYACIAHPEYTKEALNVYVNDWKMDVYNGEIVKASAIIIKDLKKKYPMVKITRSRLEKNDETRYYIYFK